MNDEIKNLLESVRRGEVSVDEAYLKLRTAPFRDLGFAKIDTHRRLRTGAAEVIYGAGKTPEQMLEIIKAMLESGQETILITRLEKHAAEILNREFALNYCEIAKIGSIGSTERKRLRCCCGRRHKRYSRCGRSGTDGGISRQPCA